MQRPDPADEEQGQTYRFVGARFRYMYVPKFVLNLFADGGTGFGVPMPGIEYGTRRNGFEWVFALSYASLAFDTTAYKSKSDGDDAWELVSSNLKAVYLTSEAFWSEPIDRQLSFVYGFGGGLGVLFGGDLSRQQARPLDPNDPGDPSGWAPCAGPGGLVHKGTNPATGQPWPAPQQQPGYYCDDTNDHYGGYTEPGWLHGGSKPLLLPWASVATGLRWKPARELASRLDVGWNLLGGPFFGLSGTYGL
jgi:hypothetical protein